MTTSGGIDVTVVLPTRDRWPLAQAARDSALAQRDVVLEVCVVDDGSQSPMPSGFAADRRVRVFRHEQPRGVAASRNRAIAEARGQWIAFLDDDDVWAPWHLSDLLKTARDQGARWAFSGYVKTDLERVPLGAGPTPVVEEDCERQFLHVNSIGTPSALTVASDVVRSIGGFDETMSVLADWDLWVRLSAAWRPAASRTLSVGYAQHEGNMSLDMDLALGEWAEMSTRYSDALARHGIVLGDNEHFWRWLARGYDRQGRRLSAARFYLRAATTGRSVRDLFRLIGTVPIVGWPVRLRRRLRAAAERRNRERETPSSEYEWLRVQRDQLRAASSGVASARAQGSSRRTLRT